ncbi:dienelactone hydrolase family protein [Catellatospora coxensis]
MAAGRFPAIAFGHGFLQSVSKYYSTMQHLASWGFVVAAPTSQGSLFPSHSAFADDLNAQLTWLVAQDTTAGSRFNAHVVTTKLGLSGHSMGGGASVLAAARNPAVTTVANLAAAETNPSAATAAASVRVPMMLVAGRRTAPRRSRATSARSTTASPRPSSCAPSSAASTAASSTRRRPSATAAPSPGLRSCRSRAGC